MERALSPVIKKVERDELQQLRFLGARERGQ